MSHYMYMKLFNHILASHCSPDIILCQMSIYTPITSFRNMRSFNSCQKFSTSRS